MASLTRWTWVSVNSRSWWWTGRPGVLRFMGSQRVRHDWETELNWTELNPYSKFPQTLLSLRIPSDFHSFSQIPSESPSFIMSSQTHFFTNSSQSHFLINFSYPPSCRFQLICLLSEILLTSSEYSIRNLLFPRIHSHCSSFSLNSLSFSLCHQPLSFCLASIFTQKISPFIYPLLTSLHLCVCNLHLHVSLCFQFLTYYTNFFFFFQKKRCPSSCQKHTLCPQ